METRSSITIPRAADLRTGPRRGAGGKPYIGPKVQVHIPEWVYDAVLDGMEARGLGDDDYPEMLREVFAAGVTALGLPRGGA